MRTPPVFVAALLATGACGELESTPAFEEAGVHVVIRRTEGQRPTGRLIGWNVGRGTLYGPEGDPLHPQWRTPEREQAFEWLSQIRSGAGDPPLVRFSGLQVDGALGSDGYHFWDYADPDHVVAEDDNMAPFQYMAIARDIGADPLVTLNYGSGTAEEASLYVDHLVGTNATPQTEARAHWGDLAPYDVHTFEIGNEVYGSWNTGFLTGGAYSYANPEAENGGDPNWHGRPSADPSAFAARSLAYMQAVSAVDPQARYWVPLSQASMDAWGGIGNALPALTTLLTDPRIDGVVVHHYQIDDLGTLGYPDKTAPELALAGSDVFKPLYQDLQGRLSTLSRSTPLKLAITEYHVAGAFTFGGFDPLATSHLVGLGVADVLLGFANLGVDVALQHMAVAFGGSADAELLFEPWYNPLRATASGEVLPNPSYVATKLIAAHLRRDTLDATVQSPTLQYSAGTNGFTYGAIHAAAFGNDDSTTLIMLNRDLDAAHLTTFDVAEGTWEVEAAFGYAPDGWADFVDDSPIDLVPIEVEDKGGRFRLELPPHALVAVALVRR